MDISAGIAATQLMTQQAISLSVVKQAADMQQKMADLLAQSADSMKVPAGGRGNVVNIAA